MAAYYIMLRTVQPEGPYFLGGWSRRFGCFEMAQQLLLRGSTLGCCVGHSSTSLHHKPSFWEGCKFHHHRRAIYMAFSPGLFVSGDCPTAPEVCKRFHDHFTLVF